MQKNWKLKLRYGKLTTPYSHFTAIAQGIAGQLPDEFSCPPGNAYISMKMWAENSEQAADMITVIGGSIGFQVTGKIEVFDTPPEDPPEEQPYGYSIKFTPFQDD